MGKVKKIILILSLIILCSFTILHMFVVFSSSFQEPLKSDAILILGFGLVDGEHPDEWLESRLSKGLTLYNEGFGEYIIVSGGKGPTDNIPVSYAMKNWLIEREVPKERILIEDKAVNTFENIILSKAIMNSKNLSSVVVVTSDFHLFRALKMSKDHFDNVSGVASNSEGFFKKTIYYLREDLAVLKYLIFKS
ncbi:YdcF family protein [Herbivorax sp. ANBcel31]|uniref:YdcF family protein n=1 Tax=Herbivorax sp. ANBcel31 TaxID=3069754 RepID=UPI0027B81ED6|nr:YdcF family protein [Herbivorax sp. ANBcel31]MDQ2087520.1 YdcF family protein [Herbivorax sp. ANBcel31]